MIYKQLNDRDNEALCLVSETGILSQMGKIEECAKKLDVLLDVCQDVEDEHLQAKIYHDIGLLYISEKLYESAAECLEQSLHCISKSKLNDEHLHATVLQNIGAVCNHMKLYKRAVHFHKQAVDLYGELGDRKAQTQVFNNLAYAYAQILKYSDAITAFQHAIQAAKDSGDREAQCLAMEGLGAIWFRSRNFSKAVAYYKDAMRLLSLNSELDTSHADRIVDKLVDAIQYQLNSEGKSVGREKARMIATGVTGGGGSSGEEAGTSGKGQRRSMQRDNSYIVKGFEATTSEEEEEREAVSSASEASDDETQGASETEEETETEEEEEEECKEGNTDEVDNVAEMLPSHRVSVDKRPPQYYQPTSKTPNSLQQSNIYLEPVRNEKSLNLTNDSEESGANDIVHHKSSKMCQIM